LRSELKASAPTRIIGLRRDGTRRQGTRLRRSITLSVATSTSAQRDWSAPLSPNCIDEVWTEPLAPGSRPYRRALSSVGPRWRSSARSRARELLDGREPDYRHLDAYPRLTMTDATAEAYGLMGDPQSAKELLVDGLKRARGGKRPRCGVDPGSARRALDHDELIRRGRRVRAAGAGGSGAPGTHWTAPDRRGPGGAGRGLLGA
jgi:hypothetical protein